MLLTVKTEARWCVYIVVTHHSVQFLQYVCVCGGGGGGGGGGGLRGESTSIKTCKVTFLLASEENFPKWLVPLTHR